MAKQQTKKEESKPKATKAPKHFAKTYSIRGYGTVHVGDEVTKEAMVCWNKIAAKGSKPAVI